VRRAEHLRAAVRLVGAVQTANAPGGAVQPVQQDRRSAGDAAVAAQGEAAEPDGGAEGAADAADDCEQQGEPQLVPVAGPAAGDPAADAGPAHDPVRAAHHHPVLQKPRDHAEEGVRVLREQSAAALQPGEELHAPPEPQQQERAQPLRLLPRRPGVPPLPSQQQAADHSRGQLCAATDLRVHAPLAADHALLTNHRGAASRLASSHLDK